MSVGRAVGLKSKRDHTTSREKKKAARQFAPKKSDRKAKKMLLDERDKDTLSQLKSY